LPLRVRSAARSGVSREIRADLLARVTRVSVETQAIVEAMRVAPRRPQGGRSAAHPAVCVSPQGGIVRIIPDAHPSLALGADLWPSSRSKRICRRYAAAPALRVHRLYNPAISAAASKDAHAHPHSWPRYLPRRAFGAHAGAGFSRARGGTNRAAAVEGFVLAGVDRGICADRHRIRHGTRATAPAVCAAAVAEALECAVHAGRVRADCGGVRAAQSFEV